VPGLLPLQQLHRLFELQRLFQLQRVFELFRLLQLQRVQPELLQRQWLSSRQQRLQPRPRLRV
jgi:hypothetical protein